MGEGDWWVCAECTSLNNFAAGRCYSCAAKKPKQPTRAAEILNYRVIESWDGKVTMEQLMETEPEPEPGPRPLREPVPRSVETVAPRAPIGARITYAPRDPVLMPSDGLPAPQPPPARPRPPDHLPVGAPPAAIGPPAGPAPPAPPPPAGMDGAPPGPIVAVGPGPPGVVPAPPRTEAPLWPARPFQLGTGLFRGDGLTSTTGDRAPAPGLSAEAPMADAPRVPEHWDDLLRPPAPDPERLRAVYGDGSGESGEVASRSDQRKQALSQALGDRRQDKNTSS